LKIVTSQNEKTTLLGKTKQEYVLPQQSELISSPLTVL
jgi:hypothetical protein